MDESELLDLLETVLDRRRPLDAVAALKVAAFPRRTTDMSAISSNVALGFDTNVVLRLADRGRADVIDYLASRHPGPLILPGQVVQEFWKNSLAEIQTLGTVVLKKYQQLADDIRRLDLDVAPFDVRFQQLVDEFAETYGSTYDDATERRIAAVLEALHQRAVVRYVPRSRFQPLAEVRHQTKTPPGFMDTGRGDFFVWADFLSGLLSAKGTTGKFDLAVLVTEDQKKDWSRNGQAHPVLVAEVQSLLDCPFETWTLARLGEYVSSRLSALEAPV